MAKKKNPPDLTARNIRPRDRQIAALDELIAAIDRRVLAAEARLDRLDPPPPPVTP